MTEFMTAIAEAIAAARGDLDRARSEGALDDAIVHEGRLEELSRLAIENGCSAA